MSHLSRCRLKEETIEEEEKKTKRLGSRAKDRRWLVEVSIIDVCQVMIIRGRGRGTASGDPEGVSYIRVELPLEKSVIYEELLIPELRVILLRDLF